MSEKQEKDQPPLLYTVVVEQQSESTKVLIANFLGKKGKIFGKKSVPRLLPGHFDPSSPEYSFAMVIIIYQLSPSHLSPIFFFFSRHSS